MPDVSFRDPAARIGSSTAFNALEFSGTWRVRRAMRPAKAPFWLNFGILAAPEAPFAMHMNFENCRIGTSGCSLGTSVTASTAETTYGRFAMRFAQKGNQTGYIRDYWVLWVDPDFRTAALGAPDGSFAWIIDRAETGGADRIAAARTVLEFNGYDVSQLKVKR